jgi:hypothetical protein
MTGGARQRARLLRSETPSMILRLAAATAALALLAAPALAAPPEGAKLDVIAKDFVRLTLEAGEREPGYVDAYYGPAEWADRRQGQAARGSRPARRGRPAGRRSEGRQRRR